MRSLLVLGILASGSPAFAVTPFLASQDPYGQVAHGDTANFQFNLLGDVAAGVTFSIEAPEGRRMSIVPWTMVTCVQPTPNRAECVTDAIPSPGARVDIRVDADRLGRLPIEVNLNYPDGVATYATYANVLPLSERSMSIDPLPKAVVGQLVTYRVVLNVTGPAPTAALNWWASGMPFEFEQVTVDGEPAGNSINLNAFGWPSIQAGQSSELLIVGRWTEPGEHHMHVVFEQGPDAVSADPTLWSTSVGTTTVVAPAPLPPNQPATETGPRVDVAGSTDPDLEPDDGPPHADDAADDAGCATVTPSSGVPALAALLLGIRRRRSRSGPDRQPPTR